MADDKSKNELLPGRIVERRRFARPGPRAFVRIGAAATEATVTVNGAVVGMHVGAWTPFEFEITEHLREVNDLEVRVVDRLHTTNGFLPAVGIRWMGIRDIEIRTGPTPPRPPVQQRSATRGTQLLVDDEPFRVRGILHWGYYPELKQPWPSREQIREEIGYVRSLGFNLIKFCLWIPPPWYYEICDETGMLCWQEYPVWDMPLDDPAIKSEYAEFFRNDGCYPCVILRTLTCENDRVDPAVGKTLVDLCHEMIPGSLVLENSSWLCKNGVGDFHDEHPYLHNAQWKYYGRRMRPRLTKPLLLGETMVADSLPDGPHDTSLAVWRYQIETLERDLPDAGYVMNSIRDLQSTPMGLYTFLGRKKYRPEQWAWHGDRDKPEVCRPRDVPEPMGEIIGPRKGQWKCPEHVWWSPVVKVLDDTLPRELIEREAVFELLSGRVLDKCHGCRVLVEMWDLHSTKFRTFPLVVEFETLGGRRVVSAFRHDTPAGRELWSILAARSGPAPEIGPLVGTSILLEEWEMSADGRTWTGVKCDTPLVNRGANVFEGHATFRTRFQYPGGRRTLRCEAVADYYEFFIDGERIGEAGPRDGTWDGTRDVPREWELDLSAGEHDIEFRVRDWRGAGGLVGPVFFASDLDERIY